MSLPKALGDVRCAEHPVAEYVCKTRWHNEIPVRVDPWTTSELMCLRAVHRGILARCAMQLSILEIATVTTCSAFYNASACAANGTDVP
jgi:hypothetical protein